VKNRKCRTSFKHGAGCHPSIHDAFVKDAVAKEEEIDRLEITVKATEWVLRSARLTRLGGIELGMSQSAYGL
jgi:hypothetical protein